MSYTLINSIQNIGSFLTDLTTVDVLGVDTETTGLDPHSSKILTIQIDTGNHIYIFDCTKFKELPYLIKLIQNKTCIFHNAKFDVEMIKTNTGILLTKIFCTMVTEQMITNGVAIKKYPSLSDLTYKYYDVVLDKETREEFYKNQNFVLTESMLIYCALDVKYLLGIREKQLTTITEEKMSRIHAVEMSVLPVLASMELAGVRLNKELWHKLETEAIENSKVLAEKIFDKIITDITDTIEYQNAYDVANKLAIPVKTKTETNLLKSITELSFIRDYLKNNFNLSSPAQTKALLINVYKITKLKDTNAKTLERYSTEFEIVQDILRFREFRKSSTSFGENYLEKINPVTGRLHTTYNQLGTVSGRLSSESPNLQNVKAESAYRDCFITSEGRSFICADYSQEELRLLASISSDPKMMNAFNTRLDLHTYTASQLFDKKYEDVTPQDRSKGKSVNFGVVYGISEFGMYKNYGIPLEEGKKYLEIFYSKIYTVLGKFREALGERVWELGYSVTPMGRRRYFEKPAYFSDSKEYYKYVESVKRKGVNHPIQGAGAEVLKIAMCKIFYDNPYGNKLTLLLQIHDEILLEVDNDIAKEAMRFVQDCLLEAERKFLTNIDAEVKIQIADRWVH